MKKKERFIYLIDTYYNMAFNKSKFMKQKQKSKETALERVKELLTEAGKMFGRDKNLAKRYVKMAREIAMKFKVKIPANLKRKFCKHCFNYLVPGVNLRVRTRNGNVVYYCLECKHYMRFGYLREKKTKKAK